MAYAPALTLQDVDQTGLTAPRLIASTLMCFSTMTCFSTNTPLKYVCTLQASVPHSSVQECPAPLVQGSTSAAKVFTHPAYPSPCSTHLPCPAAPAPVPLSPCTAAQRPGLAPPGLGLQIRHNCMLRAHHSRHKVGVLDLSVCQQSGAESGGEREREAAPQLERRSPLPQPDWFCVVKSIYQGVSPACINLVQGVHPQASGTYYNPACGLITPGLLSASSICFPKPGTHLSHT